MAALVEEMQEILSIADDLGERLDVVLARHSGLTRSAITRLIDEGRVTVDGRERKASFKVAPGMRIQFAPHTMVDSVLVPCAMDLDILYEDADIIVLNKPAGLVVHPGAGNREETLVHALLARYPEMAGVGSLERPGIVHRLDKLTSGVMIVARSSRAYYALAEDFKTHAHTRVYLCVCHGHMPKPEGRIATLMHRHPKDRTKMSSKVNYGREAITNWQVLREWPGFSLLRLALETGRTHQIRVHLSDMGHPLVADPEYGGKARINDVRDPALKAHLKQIGRQMLHAHILGIKHPVTGEYHEFSACLPEDMQALIKILDEYCG